MLTESLLEEKKELIEELGVYFENSEDMPPLSARIFSLLVLSEFSGVTFDTIVESLGASKSSTSTNLQLLQSSGIVCYCTRPGDRKRYFKVDTHHIINRLDKKIEMWEKERKLHLKVSNFKMRLHKQQNTYSDKLPGIQYANNYSVFIEDVIKNLIRLKEKTSALINEQQS
ncbi:MarR family transcriptional regulator [Zhouia spongiae]|uniref:MarR family transcriptional regulator n=1 Tax=Zhouia spongiae TaxID=2202721 RepID=A0ABY3YQW6_9FLAO|nr:MarR family transcriptional regulator [Zhouia spongiae]UNY99962.1 MarR family transcriptional regulator [Zhouia spongiae]